MYQPSRVTSPRFGVNYVPSQDWMFQWMAIDPDVVRRDLEAIAGLGLDHVRVFPLWPVLQPNRTLIRRRALDDVRLVVDLAAEFALDVCVDVIQGHMSGFDFVPAWLLNWHAVNMFPAAPAIRAQADLVGAVYDAVHDAPNLLGMTLGNEVNQFQPPNPAAMPADSDQVEHWLRTLLGGAQDPDPRHVLTHSENDHLWYRDGHPFLPAHASRLGDVTTVHSWIFNGTGQRHGGLSEPSVRHAEWMVELARAFATDPRRPVWVQEVGAPSLNLEPGQVPEFCRRTVESVLSTRDLFGITWWCSHDVGRELGDFKDLEHSLGLLDVENRVKPVGRAFADAVAQARTTPPEVPLRREAVVVDVDERDVPLSRATLAPGGAVVEAWYDLRAAGHAPAVVTSTTAADPARLTALGVDHLVRVGTPA